MKKLYTFTLNKSELIEEIVNKKDSDGKEIKVLEKVEKKIPFDFFLRKSNSTINYSAELFYQSCYWDCIKRGILPLSQLQKRLSDDGGILSKEEQDWREKSYGDFFELQAKQKSLTERKDKTPEEEKELAGIVEKIVDIFTKINEFEQKRTGGLYQNTAENVARERQSLFWTLFLSYKDLGGDKQEEVFKGDTFEEKLKSYDSLIDSDNEFDKELAERLYLVASLWHFGNARTQEEFEIGIKVAENQGLINIAKNIKPETTPESSTNIIKLEDNKENQVKAEESKDKS